MGENKQHIAGIEPGRVIYACIYMPMITHVQVGETYYFIQAVLNYTNGGDHLLQTRLNRF